MYRQICKVINDVPVLGKDHFSFANTLKAPEFSVSTHSLLLFYFLDPILYSLLKANSWLKERKKWEVNDNSSQLDDEH